MTKGCEDFVMFESVGQVMFASIKYEQLPPFCSHCGIVGHPLSSCRAAPIRPSTAEKKEKNVAATTRPPTAESLGLWVRKETVVTKGPVLEKEHGMAGSGLITSNAFEALAGLDEGANFEDPREGLLADKNVECMDNNPPGGSANSRSHGIDEPNSVQPAASSSVKRGKKSTVTKEYNLRNKSIAESSTPKIVSFPQDSPTYTITSNVDTRALASMRAAANKSWADLCDEEADPPPKHGAGRLK